MTQEENSEFSLSVKFRDVGRSPHSIPEEVLSRLEVDVANLIGNFFETDQYKQSGITAKLAFDRHRSCPYPGDDAQKALEAAELYMQKALRPDFGPTAAKNLHPVIQFIKK